MAFFDMHYHSDALRIAVSVHVILPEAATTLIGMKTDADTASYKTLYLFHGLSDDHTIWMRRTSIERYATERGIAVVMPSVGRSWYTDMADGTAYFTFVTEELPRVCRSYFKGMSHRREDTLVAGLSMGGYGAIKAALRCPDTFGACISLSGALDIVSAVDRKASIDESRVIFGYGLTHAEQLRGGSEDVFALARKNKDASLPFPKLFLWCGESDFLLSDNRRFHTLLTELGVAHTYRESEGDHAWRYWDEHITEALDCILREDGEDA